MPLDRTWYNSLVDDDGTNTVGTVWGKDDVDALMDATDAALPTARSVWVPTWRHETPTGPILGTSTNVLYWHQDGDAILFTLHASVQIGLAWVSLYLNLPVPAASLDYSTVWLDVGALYIVRPVVPAPSTTAQLFRPDSGSTAAGTRTIEGTGFYYWR